MATIVNLNSPDIPQRAMVRSRRASATGSLPSETDKQQIRGDIPSENPESYRLHMKFQADIERKRIAADDCRQQHNFELHKAGLAIEHLRAQTNLAKASPPTATVTLPVAPTGITTMTASAETLSITRMRGFQSALSSLDKLKGHEEYNVWSRKVFQFVCSNELQGYLDGSQPVPPATNVEGLKCYQCEANLLTAVISGLLDNSTFALVSHLGNMPKPKYFWDELERVFRNKDANQASILLSELHNIRFSESNDPDHWIARVRELFVALLDTKLAQSKATICQLIIEALPQSYRDVSLSLQKPPDTDWMIAKFSGYIRQHSTYLKRLDARSGGGSANSVGVYAVTGANSLQVLPPNLKFRHNGQKDPDLAAQFKNACRVCLSPGHKMSSKECPWYDLRVAIGWQTMSVGTTGQPKWRPSSKQVNAADTPGAASQPSSSPALSVAATLAASPTPVQGLTQAYPASVVDGGVEVFADFVCSYPATIECPQSVIMASAGDSHPSNFLLDSGAQVHVSSSRNYSLSLSALPRPLEIRGIGDNIIHAHECGDILLPVNTNGSVFWLKITNVFYAPELGRNLISLGRLWSRHAIRLDCPSGSLVDQHGESLVRALFQNDLWSLTIDYTRTRHDPAVAQVFSATDAVIWHKHMNHLGVSGLHMLSSSGTIPKLSEQDLKSVEDCGTCAMGKGKCLPFGESTSKSEQPLELVHSDLCGPLPMSVGGYRYIASFIDDFSRVAWTFLLKAKDGFFNAFKHFLAFVERQSGLELGTMRMDGGGEYCSGSTDSFLADCSIMHQTMAPNLSQQNGVAERFNRTLLDRIRCMLLESSMADGWWAEAALTAVHVLNRTPHSSLGSRIPISVWSNKPVSLVNLHVFGSKCYTINTYKRDGKLANRATECRFLGYDGAGKCWRVLIAGTNKVPRSREVRFTEDRSLDLPESLTLGARLPLPNSDVDDRPAGNAFAPPSLGPPDLPDSVGEELPLSDEDLDKIGEIVSPLEHTPVGYDKGPRRSSRIAHRLNQGAVVSPALVSPPKTVKEPFSWPDADEWEAAWSGEFDQWDKLKVFQVVKHTPDMTPIPTMPVFVEKTNELGEVTRKKGRCVAHGDRQPESSSPTFSPVARATTFHSLAAKAAMTGGQFRQMDVATAFLHAPLKETVHLSIPAGFPEKFLIPGIPHSQQALELFKAIYGLTQSGRAWYDYICGVLASLGFTKSENDPCLFWVICPGSNLSHAYVLVYVDDLTLSCDTEEQMSWLVLTLTSKLDLKDLGEAKQLLGLEIARNWDSGTITLLQRKFIRMLLEEYNMSDARPAETPMHANALETLPSHLTPLLELEVDYMHTRPYRALLGSLNWIGLGTRPEICYALARLGQAQSNPHPAHWEALLHILCFLGGTVDMGLVYSKGTTDWDPYMYTDSAYADCPFTRCSHSGYLIMAGGAGVNWSSCKQSIVTTSSTEAEYIAMLHATKEAMWVSRVLSDLEMKLPGPLRIFADNQSSIVLAESERITSRTKHLDPHYHFIRQEVKYGTVRFVWVPSLKNAADCLTKPLRPMLFKSMPLMLGLPWVYHRFGPDASAS